MTEAAIPTARPASEDLGTAAPPRRGQVVLTAVPVVIVFGILIGVWYLGAMYCNYGALSRHYSILGQASTWNKLGFWHQVGDAINDPFPTLPSPHQVLADFWSRLRVAPNTSGSLWADLATTGEEAALGFLLGTILAVCLAFAFVRSRILELSLFPYVVMSQTVPIVALVPALLIAFGLGLRAKVLIAAYLAFYPITVSAVKGLRSINPLAGELMRSYGANALQVFLKLRLPASLPYLFAGFKVGITASLIGAIIAELPTGSTTGVGHAIISASTYNQNILLWTAIVSAALLGLILYGMVVGAERVLVRGAQEER